MFELINSKKQHKRGYRNSGELVVMWARQERAYSFLEYIQGGVQINLVVSIGKEQSRIVVVLANRFLSFVNFQTLLLVTESLR